MVAPALEKDTATGLWRIRWPSGVLSDIVNLSRANDAIASFLDRASRK